MVRISKTVAENWLADVPEEKYFWCSDGRVVKSLLKLEAALREMNSETFRYHSNELKNDFGQWVQDVIGDEKLARDLRKSTSGAQAARSLAERIAFLKGKMVAG